DGVRAGARVPHVGVLGNNSEEPLFACATDHDGRIRLLERAWQADRVAHGVVLSPQRGARLGEHAAQDLARLVERLETLRDGLEVDAEVPVLELEPAR